MIRTILAEIACAVLIFGGVFFAGLLALAGR